jgi:hypothetical protein
MLSGPDPGFHPFGDLLRVASIPFVSRRLNFSLIASQRYHHANPVSPYLPYRYTGTTRTHSRNKLFKVVVTSCSCSSD